MKELKLDFEKQDSLIPVIVQDTTTHAILMLAYANKEAVDKTIETGKAHYYSRSRNKLWLKGESSGNFQIVEDIKVDCDQDALIYTVEQQGPACHEGYQSCFFRTIKNSQLTLNQEIIKDPKEMYEGKK